MESYYLQCMVSAGQFTGEYAVAGRLFNGSIFSLFAPASDLKLDAPPTNDAKVEGAIKVELLKRQGDLSLVRLPQATLENGHTVTVKMDQLTPVG